MTSAAIAFLVTAFLLNTCGGVASKLWSEGRIALWIPALLFALDIPCWFVGIAKGFELGRMSVLWETLAVIAGVVVGVGYFDEPLTTVKAVGMAIALVGVIVMEIA